MTVAIRGRLQGAVKTAGLSSWPAVRSAVIPVGIVLLALFLRTYRLHIISINFDTYEQLTATKRLLSADFPISKIYPPGIAVIMAAPMSVLPRTVMTMQGVIVACSVALVGLSYVVARRISGDHLAAVLFSLAVAVSPRMVYYSRFELFDVVNALGVAAVIFLVPALRGRPAVTFIAYGVLLAIVTSIRTTNVVLLPAVAIYWTDPGRHWPTLGSLRHTWLRREAVTAGVAFSCSSAVLLLIGGSLRQATMTPIDLHDYVARVLYYGVFVFSDFAVLLVLPLALLGARQLWQRNATLVMVAAYLAAAWPVAHASVSFFADRYMLPGLWFGLFLAAHGASHVYRRSSNRAAFHVLCLAVVVAFFGSQLALDGYLLKDWPARASRGAEAVYGELRPRIAQLSDGSLIVTAHSRGLRDSNPRIRYLDVLDQSMPSGINSENTDAMLRSIREAQSAGHEVYYLYSDFEADKLSIGLPGPTYETYFAAVAAQFELTEIFRATSVNKFRLYRVGKPRQEVVRQHADGIRRAGAR